MIIRKETYKGRQVLGMASGFQGRELSDVYTNPSIWKKRAYEGCIEKFVDTVNGSNFHIASYNSQTFTVAWCGEYVHPETGEIVPAKFVETAQNSYVVI